MTPERNKAIARRFVEEPWNQGRLETIDELCAPEYRQLNGGAVAGREEFKRAVAAARAAVPDLSATIHEVVAEGDLVMYRFTMRGTQLGELLGTQGAGGPVFFTGFTLLRFAGGEIVEDRFVGEAVNAEVVQGA